MKKFSVIIILLFLISCKEDIKNNNGNKSNKSSNNNVVTNTIKKKIKPNYYEITTLKNVNDFTFLYFLSNLPKANLPIKSEDYNYFLIKKGKCSKGFSKKFVVNEKFIKNYPIFIVKDYSFDSLKISKLVTLKSINKTLEEFSLQEALEETDTDIDFYYLIPIFYFPVKQTYVIAYIQTIVGYKREKEFSGIVLQAYDKKGIPLGSKYDEIYLLLKYYNESYCYEQSSNISENYIITEIRQSNDPDAPNRTVKWKITNKGIKIIK